MKCPRLPITHQTHTLPLSLFISVGLFLQSWGAPKTLHPLFVRDLFSRVPGCSAHFRSLPHHLPHFRRKTRQTVEAFRKCSNLGKNIEVFKQINWQQNKSLFKETRHSLERLIDVTRFLRSAILKLPGDGLDLSVLHRSSFTLHLTDVFIQSNFSLYIFNSMHVSWVYL